MNRISIMTTGLVLIFVGIQLSLIETYVLTPRATKFLAERFEEGSPFTADTVAYDGSQFRQPIFKASYSRAATLVPNAQKHITPPSWICWPIIFFGAVLLLHAAALKPSG